MTNNKQQTAVEWFSVRRDVLEIEVRLGKLSPIEYAEELTKAEQQAKEMEKEQKSIKLPSDEEIDEKAFQVPYDNTKDFYDLQFIKGAKWMRDKIKGDEQ